jgi:hypothetical protein
MLHACLYTICFVFCYTSWHFYAFSRTNLLTRYHSASSLFSAVFVFQKSYTENILRIGRNKSRSSYFSWHETESKAETEGTRGQPHHRVARASPWLRHQVVGPPGPPPNIALPPIYSPRWENLKHPINFPRNILQAAAVVDARSDIYILIEYNSVMSWYFLSYFWNVWTKILKLVGADCLHGARAPNFHS